MYLKVSAPIPPNEFRPVRIPPQTPPPHGNQSRQGESETFELCPIDTANVRDSKQKQKMGRHEVPTLMNSRQETLNPKGFAKENWAHRLLIQKYE
ncbi:MAG: hypothetical protein UR19_C0003G0053 [Candidatus Nomurabacteria bacterium GW2011_GWF1_31_48]|uniref:Uncharacterized protein n=1 Tax=Candidatus Nomurabacteria bacterium GW2011_GWF1_31_48 TaxID=1618767 RepID=A0A0G0BGP4_9BACT|nr:MAG: hypothetical protein UR19_C0003G0053 [Candidatus Nomurabacteria bacterium GW2011_GWF1_31_48]